MKNILGLLILCSSLVACSKFEQQAAEAPARCSLTIRANYSQDTKTVFDGVNAAQWAVGDSIAVAAAKGGEFTDAVLQKFEGDNVALARSADFSGTLSDDGAGDYTLYALYPYRGVISSSAPTVSLPNLQYPTASSWDPDCDIMVGLSAEQTCSTGLGQVDGAITFYHQVGWLSLTFAGFDSAVAGLMDEKVEYVRVSSDVALAGSKAVDFENHCLTGAVAGPEKFIIADVAGLDKTLGELTAMIAILPVDNADVEIAVRTTDHYIVCSRTGMTIAAGEILAANLTYAAGASVSANQAAAIGAQPSMASKTEGTLNVLLLGHSFGQDCTQYVPDLLSAAGITNVNLCRFFWPDCSLEGYKYFIQTGVSPKNFEIGAPASWTSLSSIRVQDKLKEIPWDVVVLQQSTAGSLDHETGKYQGAGDYDTYQPYLSFLIEYISCVGQTVHGKKPFIAWNMIHAYNNDHSDMFDAICTATQSMATDSGISLVLTPGTAVEKARTQFSADSYNLLTRDDWHASLGIGRYVEACTWFEQLFVPIYGGGLTVAGNTFRPEFKSFSEDEVTAGVAAVLQNIAVATASSCYDASWTPVAL